LASQYSFLGELIATNKKSEFGGGNAIYDLVPLHFSLKYPFRAPVTMMFGIFGEAL